MTLSEPTISDQEGSKPATKPFRVVLPDSVILTQDVKLTLINTKQINMKS